MFRASLCTEFFAAARLEAAGAARHGLAAAPLVPHTPRAQQWVEGGGGCRPGFGCAVCRGPGLGSGPACLESVSAGARLSSVCLSVSFIALQRAGLP